MNHLNSTSEDDERCGPVAGSSSLPFTKVTKETDNFDVALI